MRLITVALVCAALAWPFAAPGDTIVIFSGQLVAKIPSYHGIWIVLTDGDRVVAFDCRERMHECRELQRGDEAEVWTRAEALTTRPTVAIRVFRGAGEGH